MFRRIKLAVGVLMVGVVVGAGAAPAVAAPTRVVADHNWCC